MIMELRVLPVPLGTPTEEYAHVDAAIRVIASCGRDYRVEPLGTTVEGSPDDLWPLARQVHEAVFASGAERCITHLTIAEGPGITRGDLTAKYR